MTVFAISGTYRDPDVWRWHPHPEVWLLVVSLLVLYLYAAKVIGPKVVPAGTPPISRLQWWCFGVAMFLLEFASDWPMHDIGEEYLYSVHMVQHWILTLIMPPLFLLATPRWLADLILGQGKARAAIAKLVRPVPAAVLYNAGVVFSHWPYVVDHVVGGKSGFPHFALHMGLVTTSLIMWTCVCGPIKEWRISAPAQMIYLFLNSVVPTVPGAWLTFATHPVYPVYNTPFRAFGISAINDQQAAGVIMKLGEGGYLWAIITYKFFSWVGREEARQNEERKVRAREMATLRALEADFAAGTAAPKPDREGLGKVT